MPRLEAMAPNSCCVTSVTAVTQSSHKDNIICWSFIAVSWSSLSGYPVSVLYSCW